MQFTVVAQIPLKRGFMLLHMEINIVGCFGQVKQVKPKTLLASWYKSWHKPRLFPHLIDKNVFERKFQRFATLFNISKAFIVDKGDVILIPLLSNQALCY